MKSESASMFVRPARAGLRVPLPDRPGQFLAEGGTRVRANSYWYRAIRRGDVVEAEEKTKATKTAAPRAMREPKAADTDES